MGGSRAAARRSDVASQPQTAPQAQTTPARPQARPQPPAQPPPATDGRLRRRRSLFDEQPRQFEFGGRWSSIEGDPARWQRYQDLRDGAAFHEGAFRAQRTGRPLAVHSRRPTTSAGAISASLADYERPGRLSINGLWDQIPQFYSVDTRTAYESQSEGVLVLPDATQRAIQNGQANAERVRAARVAVRPARAT